MRVVLIEKHVDGFEFAHNNWPFNILYFFTHFYQRICHVNVFKELLVDALPRDIDLKKFLGRKAFWKILIVFNQENFDGKPNKRRHGTEKDVERLKKTFGACNFVVVVVNDSTAIAIYSILKYVASIGSCLECITFAILSHGNVKCFGVKDGSFEFKKMFSILNSLEKIPKLFLIQTCQGINDPFFNKYTLRHVYKSKK